MLNEAPRRTRRWERRRAEISRAAERIFADKGFAAATLEDVAERMEMRRPSLVYYFKDKEELYDAVFSEILAELLQRIEATRDGDDPRKRMEAIASIWIDYLSERRDAATIVLRQVLDVLPSRSPATLALFEEMVKSIQEAISEGVERGVFKPMDAGQYALTIAGLSLFWVSAQPVAQRALSFDSLSPQNLENHRQLVVQLTRQLLET